MSPWDMEPIPEGSKCVLSSCPYTKWVVFLPLLVLTVVEFFIFSCLSGGGWCWSSCDTGWTDSSSLQTPGRRMGGPFQRRRMRTSHPGDRATSFPWCVWREKVEGLRMSVWWHMTEEWIGYWSYCGVFEMCSAKWLKRAFWISYSVLFSFIPFFSGAWPASFQVKGDAQWVISKYE